MLLLEIIKNQLYIPPKRYQLQFNIIFPLLLFFSPFHMNSDEIPLSICFLPSPFYQVPSCFRAILCKPIVLITLGLPVLIAVLFGQGLNCFPMGGLSHQHESHGKDM